VDAAGAADVDGGGRAVSLAEGGLPGGRRRVLSHREEDRSDKLKLSGRLIYIIIAVFINLMLMVPGIIELMRAIGKTSVHGM
jgi:hypothetical protein